MNAGKRLWARLKSAWVGASIGWSHHAPPSVATRPHDLTEVLEHSADAVVQGDMAGRITYLNPAARSQLGLAADAPLGGLSFHDFAAPGALRQWAHEVQPSLLGRGVWVGETTLRLQGRRRVPFSLMALAHRGADGAVHRYSAVLRDISHDVRVRQQIQRQRDVLGAITEALPATVVIVDGQGCYRFVNSAFERYVGLQANQILGRTAVDVLGAQEVARRKPYMQKAVGGEPVNFVLDYPGEQGPTYLSLHCIPLKLDGVVDGFVGISQDITMQRREQDRLAALAERDPLTGLYNRSGLAQHYERKVWGGEGEHLALLFIDLDHFKPVNDQLGHQTGDEVLQMFARRLGDTVRSTDVVARLGGDEFAVLLTGVKDVETAQVVANKVLAVARQPFAIGARQILVGASIGVAVRAAGDGGLPELLARADALLYQAKADGRGRQCALPQANAAAVEPAPDCAQAARV